jgi:hypothetical protein
MTVAGVEVAAASIAELALLLHRAGHLNLAEHVGIAVDTNQGPEDVRLALSVLPGAAAGLGRLRGALLWERDGHDAV